MKRFRLLWIILLPLILLPYGYLKAEPSKGIKHLLETPASTFDMYLFRLYIMANGPSYFGGPNMEEQIRIYRLDYDYDLNLVTMAFHIGPEHKLMQDFSSKNLEKKNSNLSVQQKI